MSEGFDIVYFPLGAAAFGGAERSILELASAQQAAGKRVLVCYEGALQDTDFISQAAALGVPLRCIAWAPEQGLWRVAKAAWALFGELRAPLVHFNISWRPHMWLVPVMARLRGGARLVGSMRAMPERYEDTPRKRHLGFIPGLQLWKLPDLLVGRVWARALHATVSVNRDDYPPRLQQEFGFPRRGFQSSTTAFASRSRLPTPAKESRRDNVSAALAGAFVVAYVGRVSQEKGVRYAIEALANCPAHVHLLVAGEGNDVDASRGLAQTLGLEARVHFLGYVAQPLTVFAAAHLAAVPSLWNEAFGRVVVEAMGCEVPVVATTVGGMQELFTQGVEGIFVPKADAAAIAAAITALATDEPRRAAMARAARELALGRYSTQRVAGEYGALYERVAHA